jgi:tRNA G18 (ribose-2'-O)-methylase SpoU
MGHKKLKLDELNRPQLEDFKEMSKKNICLVLDNIRSAQNIGSMFRTADAFSLKHIYLTGISATPPNKDILKTALGSTESVEWTYFESSIECIQHLKTLGYQLLSIEQTQNSTMLNEFAPQSECKYALVMGNEVEGVNQDIIDLSDAVLEIPQFGTKHSLNVSVSAGIVLWDVYSKLFLANPKP